MFPVHGDLCTAQRIPWKVPGFSMDFFFRVLHTAQRISWEVTDSPIDFLFTRYSHWPENFMGSPRTFLMIPFHGDLCTAQGMPVEFPGFPMEFPFAEASTHSRVHWKSKEDGCHVIFTQYTISKYHTTNCSTASLKKGLMIVSPPCFLIVKIHYVTSTSNRYTLTLKQER